VLTWHQDWPESNLGTNLGLLIVSLGLHTLGLGFLVVGLGLLIVCYGKGMVEPNLLEFVGVI